MAKIGLEIHVYLNTEKKLFCDCDLVHGSKFVKPNTNVCPICTGKPGAKPSGINREAIIRSAQVALILGCKVNENLRFYRKHYSWPDLPKGYQDTMSGPNSNPNGVDGNFMGVGIWECHLEEDPAAWNPDTGEVDFNRSGSPLIEIVTAPDFSSSEEVVEWLKQLVVTLDYIKAIDKRAGIKVDVNVSIDGGERVELKNINSLQNIKNAIEVEIKRQEKDLPKEKHTRRFDDKKMQTVLMRSKEDVVDYIYDVDEDLPPVVLEKEEIEKLRRELPETPQKKLERLVEKYNLSEKNAQILTKKLEIVEFFEKVVEQVDFKLATRYVTEELLSVLNYNKKDLDDIEIDEKHFIVLLNAIEGKKITELKAKDILRSWKEKSFDPTEEIERNSSISDGGELDVIIEKILKNNSGAVEDYLGGKKGSINFLIGKVMQETEKRADFSVVKDILEKRLNSI